MWNLFFVKHMLNKERKYEYDDGPFNIFVLAVMLSTCLTKKEVPHKLHPLSCFDLSCENNWIKMTGCGTGGEDDQLPRRRNRTSCSKEDEKPASGEQEDELCQGGGG